MTKCFNKVCLYLCLLLQTAFTSLLADCGQLNPRRIAASEVQVWKAYYCKDGSAVLNYLSDMFASQFGILSSEEAHVLASKFARAAMVFGSLPPGSTPNEVYSEKVLPFVVDAFIEIKEIIGGSWAPQEAAEYELRWWVDRRIASQRDPEIVAGSMSRVWQIMFGLSGKEEFDKAAYLRAMAARYRDRCSHEWHGLKEQDWDTIQYLLEQAYSEYTVGLSKAQGPSPLPGDK